jgi:hypothetical protein
MAVIISVEGCWIALCLVSRHHHGRRDGRAVLEGGEKVSFLLFKGHNARLLFLACNVLDYMKLWARTVRSSTMC